MQKIVKYLFITLISIAIILAIAIMAIVNFVNPNDYRDQIAAAASKKLQRPITIHGELNWQFLPALGMVVHDISIGPKADDHDISAKLSTAKVGVYLWPLLSKHLSIKEIKLDGLSVDVTTSTGSLKPATSADVAAAPGALGSQQGLAYLSQIDLQELEIRHSQVLLHNQLTQVTSKIDDIELKAYDIGAHKNSNFKLSLDYQADSQKPSQISIKWQGKLSIDPPQNQIDCLGCRLQLVNTLANRQHISVAASSDIHYRDHSVSAPAIVGTIDDFQFNASVNAQHLDQDADWQFSFDGNTQRLAPLLKKFGVDVTHADASTWQSLAIKASGHLQQKRLNLTLNQLQLDHGATLTGSVDSRDINSNSFHIHFGLDRIDLKPYLHLTKATLLEGVNGELKALLPQNGQTLAINGPISFANLSSDALKIQHFSTLLDMKNHKIALNQSKAQLLDGNYQGNTLLDLSGGTAKISANQSFNHIQIQPLVAFFNPKLTLSGIANISGNIDSMGSDAAQFKQNLNGNIKLNVSNGVLHGVNLQYWLDSATALLHKTTPPAAPSQNTTNFGDLSATLMIRNGVVNNQDLLLTNAYTKATGRGSIDLNRERLDYRLNLTPNARMGRLSTIPLLISGTFSQPVFRLDMNAIVQQMARDQLESHKNRLLNRLNQGGGDEDVGQALGNIIQRVQINKLLNR